MANIIVFELRQTLYYFSKNIPSHFETSSTHSDIIRVENDVHLGTIPRDRPPLQQVASTGDSVVIATDQLDTILFDDTPYLVLGQTPK